MASFNTTISSYPFPLYQSAYWPQIVNPQVPNMYAGPYGHSSSCATVLDPTQPDQAIGPLTGSQLILFMESNCLPGTEVGPPCAAATELQFDVCLQNDHTSGTSVGIRSCR
jgi:hypothetical protein